MLTNDVFKPALFTLMLVMSFATSSYTYVGESGHKNKLAGLKNFNTTDLSTDLSKNHSSSNNTVLITENSGKKAGKSAGEKENSSQPADTNIATDNRRPQKEEPTLEANPVQFCQGKYKKMSSTGFEFITVRCPSVEDTCTCELDIKGFREWVECGGKRKPSSKGSDFIECRSVIVGN